MIHTVLVVFKIRLYLLVLVAFIILTYSLALQKATIGEGNPSNWIVTITIIGLRV